MASTSPRCRSRPRRFFTDEGSKWPPARGCGPLIAFLEKHGQHRLAAELAESRDLPAGMVVRQWFLARDVRRAIRLAEERGAFADAIARLERTHRSEAQALRMLWAERLASKGDYAS